MSKEMTPTVNASGGKERWRDKLSPKNKARAATGFVWWNHAQSVLGTGAAIGLAATGSLGAAALTAGWVGFNELVEVPIAKKYRNNRRKEAGMPPIESKRKLFRRQTHQVHQEAAQVSQMSEVHKLPQRGTIYQTSDRKAA